MLPRRAIPFADEPAIICEVPCAAQIRLCSKRAVPDAVSRGAQSLPAWLVHKMPPHSDADLIGVMLTIMLWSTRQFPVAQ